MFLNSASEFWSVERVGGFALLRKLAVSELIPIALLLTFTLGSFDTDLFVVLLEGSQVLTSLRKFAFFHILADIPMHEGPLAVHKIKLVVDAGEYFCDSCAIADHTTSQHYLCKVSARNNCWRLVVDPTLETCGTPVHELDGPLGLNGGHCCIHILGHNIPPPC